MVFDLNAVGLEGQAEAQRRGCFHHVAAEGFPVEVGPSAQVRVVVAHGTVHFGHHGNACDALAHLFQAHHHVGHLFAHRGGAGGLAVGAAEHGHVGESVGHLAQLGNQAVEAGQDHVITAGLQLQGVAGVVDVFAGASKVHKFRGSFEFGVAFEFLLDPVLHRFHVVVGDLLFVLDGQRVFGAEVRHQTDQIGTRLSAQRFEFNKSRIAQGDEPRNLHLHATVHIALLAHQGAQGGDFASVAAIEWREGGDL